VNTGVVPYGGRDCVMLVVTRYACLSVESRVAMADTSVSTAMAHRAMPLWDPAALRQPFQRAMRLGTDPRIRPSLTTTPPATRTVIVQPLCHGPGHALISNLEEATACARDCVTA
jgi:hypothetical protein